MRLPLALILAATTASAQERLNAEQFDALLSGLTITYLADDGVTVGVEAYHPNGRVTGNLSFPGVVDGTLNGTLSNQLIGDHLLENKLTKLFISGGQQSDLLSGKLLNRP